jgi:quercetin dioxygenase-like cupin family protein
MVGSEGIKIFQLRGKRGKEKKSRSNFQNNLIMKFTKEEGELIQFRKTTMVLKTPSEENNAGYLQLLMTHPPYIGPGLHIHPSGPETFLVVEGTYTFTLGENIIETTKGDFVFIPQNIPHKYNAGEHGGQLLVTTPEAVVNYFKTISSKLLNGEEVSAEFEYECAKANGQIFVDSEGGFGHK